MTHMTLQAVRRLIANDSYAITFQSVGQYRTTLLRHVDSLVEGPTAAPHAFRTEGQDERHMFENDVLDLFDGKANFQRNGGGEYSDSQVVDMWLGWSMRAALARHAQPDGEAPQAELMADANRYVYLASTADWSAIEDLLRRSDAESATELKRDLDKLIDAQLKTAITLPLYTARAAQHAESGAPAAIPTWQERMPKPRRAYTCDMNCSRDRRHESPTSCGDCMPVTVHGDPVKARDAEIADLRAALAAQSQGAPAIPARLTRYSMWSNSTAHGMDASPTGQWASFDELQDALTSQQAAAPGVSAQPHKIHELMRIYVEKNGDWCAIARAVESRYVDADSAPGTPEAPADIVLDAQRWRALLGSARIRPLGSAGIVNPQSGNYAHMGLEIWTTGDWSDCSPDLQKRLKYDHDVGVEWLTKYADIARAAQLDGGQGEGES